MDYLWTPWRFAYVTSADAPARRGVPKVLEAWQGDLGCVFCNLIAAMDHAIVNGMDPAKAEAAAGLVLRSEHCFICLNAFAVSLIHFVRALLRIFFMLGCAVFFHFSFF